MGAWVMTWLVLGAGASGAFGQTGRDGQGRPAGTGNAGARPAATKTAAATTAPAVVDPARAAKMDAILENWAKVSRANETLYAQFTRTDRSPAWPEPKVFEGQALLRKPNLACLEFQETVKDKPKPIFNQRIVCSGDQVYQFLGPTKQVFVYPMAADERRRALEEGPLPLMFNMRVDAARQRYRWELREERPATKEKPATYIIMLEPLQEIDREEFTYALIMLNQETLLPEALQLTAPNRKDTKTFVFKKVERNGANNPAARPANYDGESMAREFEKYGYKVIVNPDENGQPAKPAPVAPRAAAGNRPAKRNP
jgi:TIGR03009 family protein